MTPPSDTKRGEPLTCAKVPCKSCPYRKDVPSGLWATEEYEKLPSYDGDILAQLTKRATGVFMCHQQDGRLCAGWIGAHGASNLLAIRMSRGLIDYSIATYQSPVPLFKSGAAAAEHGKREIEHPGARARRAIDRLVAKRECRQNEDRP